MLSLSWENLKSSACRFSTGKKMAILLVGFDDFLVTFVVFPTICVSTSKAAEMVLKLERVVIVQI